MSDDTTLTALVKNTESLTNMAGTMVALQQEMSQSRQAAREAQHSMTAKVDNLDRSVQEMHLSIEKAGEEQRRVYDLLREERKDRRELTHEAGKPERELLRQLIQEELGDRRKERSAHRNMISAAASEVWRVGGKYIILALSVLIVGAVMKLTGLSVIDIIGVVKQ